MPRPYPREFRDDVVRVARNRDDGVTIEQIATDFGVHPMTLTKWMRQADIDEGTKPIDGFDVTGSSITASTFDYLSSLEWIRAHQNLAVTGAPCQRKSHLLTACGHPASDAGSQRPSLPPVLSARPR